MRGRTRGFSLIEALITLTVVASAFMLLLGVFGPSSKGVQFVWQRVVAENLARRQMETIKTAAYSPNPTVQPYPTIATGQGYQIAISVSYWLTGTNAFTTALPAQDSGLQMITVDVSRPGSTTFSLQNYKGAR
jgi:prepilin-type N-terminal cleavage/methylation domain-containing protein